MSLDVYLKQMPTEPVTVYSANITHNLNTMADKAGLYQALWRPEEIGITKAGQLIPVLEEGLTKLRNDPAFFQEFNHKNRWGSYDSLVRFTQSYLDACKESPEALVEACR